MRKQKVCELCKTEIESCEVDWCYVKTNKVWGRRYYHNNCFDDMWFANANDDLEV